MPTQATRQYATFADAGTVKALPAPENCVTKGAKNMLESLLATMQALFRRQKQKESAVSDTERKVWEMLVARLKDNRPPLSTATGNRQLPNLSER